MSRLTGPKTVSVFGVCGRLRLRSHCPLIGLDGIVSNRSGT